MNNAFTNKLLSAQSDLGLSDSEIVLLLNIASFRWGDRAPFPSLKTLADRMGKKPRALQKILAALDETSLGDWRKVAQDRGVSGVPVNVQKRLNNPGLIRRIDRRGKSSEFDLQPLMDLLENAPPSGRTPPSHRTGVSKDTPVRQDTPPPSSRTPPPPSCRTPEVQQEVEKTYRKQQTPAPASDNGRSNGAPAHIGSAVVDTAKNVKMENQNGTPSQAPETIDPVHLLTEAGVKPPNLAQQLAAEHTPERIAAVIRWARDPANGRKNVPGTIRQALTEEWSLSAAKQVPAEYRSRYDEREKAAAKACTATFKKIQSQHPRPKD